MLDEMDPAIRGQERRKPIPQIPVVFSISGQQVEASHEYDVSPEDLAVDLMGYLRKRMGDQDSVVFAGLGSAGNVFVVKGESLRGRNDFSAADFLLVRRFMTQDSQFRSLTSMENVALYADGSTKRILRTAPARGDGSPIPVAQAQSPYLTGVASEEDLLDLTFAVSNGKLESPTLSNIPTFVPVVLFRSRRTVSPEPVVPGV